MVYTIGGLVMVKTSAGASHYASRLLPVRDLWVFPDFTFRDNFTIFAKQSAIKSL